jgi:Glycosyltransferase family 87
MLIALRLFFTKTIFSQKKYLIGFWFIVAFFAITKTLLSGKYNNYLIFKFTFYSLINQRNFFLPQPENFGHYNLYGPTFSLLIAPFAVLPNWLGLSLWVIFNCSVLLWALRKLPMPEAAKNAVIIIALHENLTSILSCQFNPSMTAIIVLTFVFINNKNNFWAAFLIAFGTLVKLYGIVGLAFFFFSTNKKQLILSLIFWFVILFALPMLFSSPQFILQSYKDWYVAVTEKNVLNADPTCAQDISLMGIVRRISNNLQMANWPYILVGVVVFLSTYLRISQYKFMGYRLMLLASVLIFTVIFSTSAESPTYIIAFAGVAIWFAIQPRPYKWYTIALFVFAFLLTSLSPSDIFPKFLKEAYIKPYSLKALPCVFIWISIVIEMWTQNFSKYNFDRKLEAVE